MRPAVLVIALSCLIQACGSGGSSGGGGQATVYYVRTSGNDANTGLAAGEALATIAAAVRQAESGDTVVVGPGSYVAGGDEAMIEIIAKTASAGRPILIRADDGAATGDPRGEVLLEADGRLFGVRFSGCSNIILDGFVVRGARGLNGAGVHVRDGSTGIIIRNSEVTEGVDGIRVEDSDDTVIFNNLIHANSLRGIRISRRTSGTLIVNNTITDNLDDGISGSGDAPGAVRDTRLRNNIVFDNGARGIDFAAASTVGYDSNFNLVFPTMRNGVSIDYGPATPKGLDDVSLAPLFVGRFRLAQIGAGDTETSPAVDAGDPATAGELADELRRRTTANDDALDFGLPDLGVHFPSALQPQPTPTGQLGTPTVGPTAPPAAQIYVRASGNNGNSGRSPDLALRSIQAALDAASAGTEIIVGPGRYPEDISTTRAGTAELPILLRADSSGIETLDAPGAVVVDGELAHRGFFIDGAKFLIIDGFTVVDTLDAAIQIRRLAEGVVIRNCEIYGGREDGIRVQDSPGVTLFNNLIYCNGRRGIVVAGTTGSPDARLINNTVVGNRDRGIFIGTSTAPSAGAFLHDNMIQDNCGNQLQVAANSLDGYSGQYNLVSPPSYVGAMVHPTDTAYGPEGALINVRAGFVSRALCEGLCPARPAAPPQPTPQPTPAPLPSPPDFTIIHAPDDFRLRQTIAGDPPPDGVGVDQGDPSLQREFTDTLRPRTTASNGEPDGGRIDLGYHYPR